MLLWSLSFGTSSKTGIIYYRPQRSCGKVIFSQVCVKNSVHRGRVSASVHAGIHGPPPGRHPMGRHPSGRHPQQTPPADTPRQTPTPWVDTLLPSACWDGHGYCCGRYASYWNVFLLNNKSARGGKMYSVSYLRNLNCPK